MFDLILITYLITSAMVSISNRDTYLYYNNHANLFMSTHSHCRKKRLREQAPKDNVTAKR